MGVGNVMNASAATLEEVRALLVVMGKPGEVVDQIRELVGVARAEQAAAAEATEKALRAGEAAAAAEAHASGEKAAALAAQEMSTAFQTQLTAQAAAQTEKQSSLDHLQGVLRAEYDVLERAKAAVAEKAGALDQREQVLNEATRKFTDDMAAKEKAFADKLAKAKTFLATAFD